MKTIMSDQQFRAMRDKIAAAHEKHEREAEISLAKLVQQEVPGLTWGQAMREACRIRQGHK